MLLCSYFNGFLLYSQLFYAGTCTYLTHSAISPAICRYGDYLEGVYSRSSVSSDGKFPPTPSKTYVNLAVVKHSDQVSDLKDVRKNTLYGRVDEMLTEKTKIEISDILKPLENGKPVSLAFVEGPPGIGKSTLAWELCRRWDRKQYDLAVLLRLREREVQQIESIADLFPHVDQDLQKSVAKDVLGREGKGVLFILDGYDELPSDLRKQGLLFKLLRGEVLPECSVLVTSRPSATRDLYRACRPQIQRNVEILGFTQESVELYASSVLSCEPDMLNDFLQFISASKTPSINSLMYIPLNAAIVVEIYRSSRRKGCAIPQTMTQIYKQLCLTLIQRYVDSIDPPNDATIVEFSDLPSACYIQFKKLAHLAFELFEQNNLVFSLPGKFVHFGFLDSIQALYGGCGVSYNFLHLTLQEFLAAYHITQLPNGKHVFEQYWFKSRWELVWRFVSGLTNFQYYEDGVRFGALISEYKSEDDHLLVTDLLLHCLCESQSVLDCIAMVGDKFSSIQYTSTSSPLDRYALGYCIANSSRTTSWKVEIHGGSDESFLWGLNSNQSGGGIISHLEFRQVDHTRLDSYPTSIIRNIKHLKLRDVDSHLVQVVPQIKSLTSLHLDWEHLASAENLKLLVSKINVEALKLETSMRGYGSSTSDKNVLSSLCQVINSPSNKLMNLKVKDTFFHGTSCKPLCDTLFGSSNLNQLTLKLSGFSKKSFDLLERNTCLTTLRICSLHRSLPLESLTNILLNNKTIISLRWGHCMNYKAYSDQAKAFNVALSSNTALKDLTLGVSKYGSGPSYRSFISDCRVKYEDTRSYRNAMQLSLTMAEEFLLS